MSLELDSASPDNYAPIQWLIHMSDSGSVPSEQIPLSDGTYESPFSSTSFYPLFLWERLPTETQLDARATNVDDSANTRTVCSSPIPPPPSLPSLQPVAFYPPKWQEIPQRPYDHGRKQWDYTRSGPILFQVNNFPGVNMGNALGNKFAGLEGRDDLVLQDAKKAISCRFLFPGYPPNKSAKIFTTYSNMGHDEPLTRSKLAHQVARKLKQYLDSSRSHIMDHSTDEKWRIGEGYMRLDEMFLAKLESVSRGSFQAQIWVTNPTA